MSEIKLNTIEEAIEDFREGKFLIVVDDEDRENEGDFIMYEAVLRQLKGLARGKKLPSISKLNTEIEGLISEKNAA
mgnify:CR=1 FL=1